MLISRLLPLQTLKKVDFIYCVLFKNESKKGQPSTKQEGETSPRSRRCRNHPRVNCDWTLGIAPPLLRARPDHLQSSGSTRSYKEQRWQPGEAARAAPCIFNTPQIRNTSAAAPLIGAANRRLAPGFTSVCGGNCRFLEEG